MFMRTWDYNGFAVGPVLALLEQIFDQKIMIFFLQKWFFGCEINRPLLMKKVRESCVLTVLTRIYNIEHIHNLLSL